MKIDVNGPIVTPPQAERIQKQSPPNMLQPSLSNVGDRTTLNSTDESVQSLTQQSLQSPVIRQGKVDAVRQSIDSGQYEVDPGKIADAMIADGSK